MHGMHVHDVRRRLWATGEQPGHTAGMLTIRRPPQGGALAAAANSQPSQAHGWEGGRAAEGQQGAARARPLRAARAREGSEASARAGGQAGRQAGRQAQAGVAMAQRAASRGVRALSARLAGAAAAAGGAQGAAAAAAGVSPAQRQALLCARRAGALRVAPSRAYTPLVVGVGVAAAVLLLREAGEAYAKWAASPASRRYFEGGFADKMTRREAAQILGIRESAKPARIKEVHRKVMLANHPDAGGSDYVASKINEAKDVLLNKKGRSSIQF